MPIHINLLEEERALAQARERDPVRLTILIGLLVLLLAGAAGAAFMVLKLQATTKFDQLSSKLQGMIPQQKEALAALEEMKVLTKKKKTWYELPRKRFLVATQLDAVKESMDAESHLTRISFDYEVIKVVAAKPPPTSSKSESASKKEERPQPPKDRKRVRLTLEGVLYSKDADQAIREFIEVLRPEADNPRPLATDLNPVESVKLIKFPKDKIVIPPQSPGGQRQEIEVGKFTIHCWYKDRLP